MHYVCSCEMDKVGDLCGECASCLRHCKCLTVRTAMYVGPQQGKVVATVLVATARGLQRAAEMAQYLRASGLVPTAKVYGTRFS